MMWFQMQKLTSRTIISVWDFSVITIVEDKQPIIENCKFPIISCTSKHLIQSTEWACFALKV